MSLVLTIVAQSSLTDADIRQFVRNSNISRLDHRAADLTLARPQAENEALCEDIRRAGFDCHLSPQEGRQKRLLICDMDSTIIEQECIDELARVAGIGDEIAEITERAMRGELNFEEALVSRVSRLVGISADVVGLLLQDAISVSPGANSLVRTMRHHGGYTALVSGGFTVFTGPVASRVGFDTHRGNELVIAEGTLTGEVNRPILGQDAKRATLIDLCHAQGLSPEDAVAIGDGANDLAMIGEAGLGIAYKAKPAVRAAARASIDHTDLTAALYYQGLIPAND